MPQIKVTITDDEYALLQTRATNNLNSISKEARLILHSVLFTETTHEIAGLEFPAFPTLDKYTYTPDPKAGSVDVPYIDPATIKDYRKPQDTSTTEQPKRVIGGPDDMPSPKATPTKSLTKKSTVPVLTDLEVEQVDNEWDAEGNEYSTEEFLIDLHHLEDKLREDVPTHDPTLDPDYVALKNYFIKHDLRERFRSLLSDPSRFYPVEGVYEQPQIKYAQAAFRKEKIDCDYIVALLSGTGVDYRTNNNTPLYIDEP